MSSESPESLSNSPQVNRRLSLQPQIRHRLCDIFFHNVDPLFKILHRPSLQAYIKDGMPYLDYEQDHQAPATLASAIYLCAVCTLDEVECQSIFSTSKNTIVAEFHQETELALAKADFVTTNDLTVLQAYIISLVSDTTSFSFFASLLLAGIYLNDSSSPLDLKTKAEGSGPC